MARAKAKLDRRGLYDRHFNLWVEEQFARWRHARSSAWIWRTGLTKSPCHRVPFSSPKGLFSYPGPFLLSSGLTRGPSPGG
jgi:hypothetical protein